MERTITRTAEDARTKRRTREAAMRYLEARGCDILECNWECAAGTIDVICDDDGTIALVMIAAGYDHLPEEDTSRRNQRRFEEITLAYLAEHEELEGLVRFDIMSFGITGEHRALLRHHKGAFN